MKTSLENVEDKLICLGKQLFKPISVSKLLRGFINLKIQLVNYGDDVISANCEVMLFESLLMDC